MVEAGEQRRVEVTRKSEPRKESEKNRCICSEEKSRSKIKARIGQWFRPVIFFRVNSEARASSLATDVEVVEQGFFLFFQFFPQSEGVITGAGAYFT